MTVLPDTVYCCRMPDTPTALPYKAKVRALIRERGYQIDDFARKMGCPPSRLYAITGRRSKPRRIGVKILAEVAAALSTPAETVRVSDISDWTGGEPELEPEPKVSAA